VQVPTFSECGHSLIKSLAHHSDQDLLVLFQRHPDCGQYFTAIFCRYSPLVYTLIRHSARSPVQADYLFAVTWRHIYHELGGLDLQDINQMRQAAEAAPVTLQSWLINMTAVCINRAELPPVEAIHYSLEHTSPPLWCYVEQALDRLSPVRRLVVLLTHTFHWSDTRIAAYLQAEGETMTTAQVKVEFQKGCQELEELLPPDIRTIYLDSAGRDRPDGTALTDALNATSAAKDLNLESF
jgi:DNA-directed RNA polymerase specialized sigma24 family protein